MDTHFSESRFGAREGAPSFSSYGASGTIGLLIEPTSDRDLIDAIRLLDGEDYVVVGRATDTLFPDGEYRGTVLSTRAATGAVFDGTTVVASAGERLTALAKKATLRGLSGLERLASVPGSVGGAAAMNAGAFGAQFADVVQYVDAVIDGRQVRLLPSECSFGYRDSVFGKEAIVTAVALSLVRSDPKTVKAECDRYNAVRAATQPSGKSLGSVFKRTGDRSAGWYIERAGLKGRRIGGAEISRKHAGFIVNAGGGTAADYVALMKEAAETVQRHCGVVLEPEVVVLGQ